MPSQAVQALVLDAPKLSCEAKPLDCSATAPETQFESGSSAVRPRQKLMQQQGVQNLPPCSTVPQFEVRRPDIYYGDVTSGYGLFNAR